MAGIYRQRHPEHTVFYRVFFYYFERFLREYENRFEKQYGYFRPVIQDVVEKILRWRHTGFNVHSQVRAQTTSEAERVGKYMIRPVLSLKRLFFDETAGKVRYQYSRHGSQEESMDYLEFIARVTSHILDKGQVMIRYYGLYSNAHRGKMRKAGAEPFYPPIIEDDPAYGPSKGWAEMIRKVYEIDPLLCPFGLKVLGELCCFLCFDLGVLGVISLVQYANRWVLRKMVWDLPQAQKRISYPTFFKARTRSSMFSRPFR
jgi:hypothetical protein